MCVCVCVCVRERERERERERDLLMNGLNFILKEGGMIIYLESRE